jgi:predicted transcriptional regulator
LNNSDNIFTNFRNLGLSSDEAKVYIELLRGPSTHLRISRNTGLNRTRVYRVADLLKNRSLITKQSDERGAFLVAADPATLQVNIVSREERVKQQRKTLNSLLPTLEDIRNGNPADFAVHTYEGIEGFKQMLWHELKTKGEVICFGNGELEKLVPDRRWTEKHRSLTMDIGYSIREILNPETELKNFTNLEGYNKHYTYRLIPQATLKIQQLTIIYNDTVAVYHWNNKRKIGTEIINKEYASNMRQVFEHFWSIALEPR